VKDERADATCKSSGEESNSTRGARGISIPRGSHDSKDPEVVPNGEGGASEANRALRAVIR